MPWGRRFPSSSMAPIGRSMNEAVDAAFEEAHRLDALLSNYRPASEWSRINREAAARPVAVSPELFRLLSDCIEYSRASEGSLRSDRRPAHARLGLFRRGASCSISRPDPRGARTGGIPARATEPTEANRALRSSRCRDRSRRSGQGLRRRSHGRDPPRTRYSQRARRRIRQQYFRAWATLPRSPAAGPSALPTPGTTGRTRRRCSSKTLSLSTSGSYEKSFRVGGHRYSHIMDPRRGVPAESAVQVTVIAPRAIDSEVWAKPYFIQGRAWTAAHKPKSWRVLLLRKHSRRRVLLGGVGRSTGSSNSKATLPNLHFLGRLLQVRIRILCTSCGLLC